MIDSIRRTIASVLFAGFILSGLTGVARADNIRGTFSLVGNWPLITVHTVMLPDGRIFGYDSGGNMYFINTAGTGSITRVGSTPASSRGGDSTVVMFRPGQILQLGGSSAGVVVIDINSASPVATATSSMATMRKLANATVMADGRVVVTGGSEVWN